MTLEECAACGAATHEGIHHCGECGIAKNAFGPDVDLRKQAETRLAEFDRELAAFKRDNPGKGINAFTATEKGKRLNRICSQARAAAGFDR